MVFVSGFMGVVYRTQIFHQAFLATKTVHQKHPYDTQSSLMSKYFFLELLLVYELLNRKHLLIIPNS